MNVVAAVVRFGEMCLIGMCTGASTLVLLRWLGSDSWRRVLDWRMVAPVSGCFGVVAMLPAGLADALVSRSPASLVAVGLAVAIGAALVRLAYIRWRQVCLVLWVEAVRPSSSD